MGQTYCLHILRNYSCFINRFLQVMNTPNLELGEKCSTFALSKGTKSARRKWRQKGGRRPPDVAGRNGI